MTRCSGAIGTLDDKWRKRNGQIVAEIIRVRMDQYPVEMENQERAGDVAAVAAAAAAAAAAAVAVVIPTVSQLIFQAMHLWKRVKAFSNCIPTVTDFCEAPTTTTPVNEAIRLFPER